MASSRVLVLQVLKWMQFGWISALTHTARLTNSFRRGLKRMVTKLQWLYSRIHDNWVAYFGIWSTRSLHRFCGRAQTYWSQSDVFNSPKACYVTPTFETKILSLGMICPDDHHQRNPNSTQIWGSVSRRDGKARAICQWSRVENDKTYPEAKGETQNNILFTFGELVSTFAINP